ncbi:MAG: hypothetical protein GY856_19865, partial [bacterium]|nr:hypothetical protein [bacterium]
ADPDPGLEGAPATITALVRNTGGQALTDVEVALFDGDPAAGGSRIGDPTILPALAPGESLPATLVLPILTGAGDRLLYVVVDPNDQIAELDEDDNLAFLVLEILSLPDLAVSASSLSVEPAYPAPGETVTVTAGVANLGEQDAAGVVVRLTSGGIELAPDQTLDLVPGAGAAEAVFTWTCPEDDAVALEVTVDPGDAVAEGSEANNIVTRLVSTGSGGPVSNRYFSPNGDGVKDTTVFTFALGSPTTVTIEIRDPRGELVRWYGGPEHAGVAAGTFAWDGLDDAGRVVADGDYEIAALGTGGARFAALVTVDNNRSPLLAALGTPYELYRNLTCLLPDAWELQLSSDESQAFLRTDEYDPEYPKGIYRMSGTGAGPERILAGNSIYHLVISDDGSHVAFNDYSSLAYRRWWARADGGELQEFESGSTYKYAYGFRGSTQELVYSHDYGSTLEALPLDGSGPLRVVAPTSADAKFYQGILSDSFSPDGRKLIYSEGNLDHYRLVDLDTGVARKFADHYADDVETVTWSPDGTRFATTANYAPQVQIWDAEGNPERTIEIPLDSYSTVPEYEPFGELPAGTVEHLQLSRVDWSTDGGEIAVSEVYQEWADSYDVTMGLVAVAEVQSGRTEVVARLEPEIWLYSYHVETWNGASWVERGALHFGLRYGEQELDLSEHLPDPTGEYKVRIRQQGSEAAHVDRVGMVLGPARRPPSSARRVAGGQDVLAAIRLPDREVLDLYQAAIEVRWDDPDPAELDPEGFRLALLAREERLSGRRARPFTYPPQGDRVYHYVVADRGPLVVDGAQRADDELGEALFEVPTYPSTGHPPATVYGYLKSDGENLYAALDFTVDNTRDGDRDWAALLVETPAGWREFRITESDPTWGTVGFVRTGKVHHTHKYYELRVP